MKSISVARWGVWQGIGRGMLGLVVVAVIGAGTGVDAMAAAPQVTGVSVSNVGTESATFKAMINPQGEDTKFHFEYGLTDCSKTACTKAPVPDADAGTGTVSTLFETTVAGLAPGTRYHFRLVAQNSTTVKSADRVFATQSPTLAELPDLRAYEQASPVDKDGGDVTGAPTQVKAAADGGGITFGSTFGIPGGQGAQALPMYLAQRDGDWLTRGLLPPADTGERAQVLGWLPDFSQVFSRGVRLGSPTTEALLVQPGAGGGIKQITPYVSGAEFAYAGASQDGSTVLFESKAVLSPQAKAGSSNVYAWDVESEELSLASVLNTEVETKVSLPKGGFAGPYSWGVGINASSLRRGGAISNYYLQDGNAISAQGAVFFTAATSGQLYLRKHPTRPQSPLDGDGECTNSLLACTVHVSISEKTDGNGPDGADPAGPQPAAFQLASADGSKVFFTSPEKLTNDANTGPEQPLASIARDTIDGEPENLEDEFIPNRHAVGVAISGSHIYWADPAAGTIGRADINGDPASVEPAFIDPGSTEYEVEPGVIEEVASTPRYVAVDAGSVYWTNTGPLDENERPINGGGTIGRAAINPISEEAEDVNPEFITGAFNPQGIAVDATHIYWANAATGLQPVFGGIGRAAIDGSSVVQQFFAIVSFTPYGVALDSTHLYFSFDNVANGSSFVGRVPLAGGDEERLWFGDAGTAGVRGIALEGSDIYWAAQEEEAIGRAPVSVIEPGECDTIEGCEREFIQVEGAPTGLAVDSTHLYWSINGEAPTNPGNDLYQFEGGAPNGDRLTDLTPDVGGINGAEVHGVLGASKSGSHVYFAANGVLAPGAPTGNCHAPAAHGALSALKGKCNLYLWHEGTISYLTQLNTSGTKNTSDSLNWAPTPQDLFASSVPKTSLVSDSGETLLFRSQEKLTSYENEGVPELYRYRVGAPAISCASCNPGGEPAESGPSMGSMTFPGLSPRQGTAAVMSRNMSADGNRVFFETTEALSATDTNGAVDCSPTGFPSQSFPSCLDVYMWEAPETGSCKAGGSSYAVLNDGCIYLISTGKDAYPSLFADASKSGADVFFFTREQLVGQDKDELQDVYDARVEGGLSSQNPQANVPCEGADACHGPAQVPPAETAPATPAFVGPGNPVPKHKKPKARKNKKHKKHKAKATKQKKGHAKKGAGR